MDNVDRMCLYSFEGPRELFQQLDEGVDNGSDAGSTDADQCSASEYDDLVAVEVM